MDPCEPENMDLAEAEKELQVAQEDWERLGRPELLSEVQPDEDLKSMTLQEFRAIRRLEKAKRVREAALKALTDREQEHVV